MKRALVIGAVAALITAAPAAAAGVRISGIDDSGYPVLRISIVSPLGSGAPVLRENGRPVAAASATNLGAEKSVVLAVDRSQSMRGGALTDAVDAARTFVAAKQPGDRLEVVAFGRQAVAMSRFSGASLDADAALAALAPDARSGTALWDAVVLAARGLRQQDQAGHVIVVLTDGQDVSSLATLNDAIAAANAAHASVYAIGIDGRGFTPQPLRELAARTGGAYRQVSSSTQLTSLYARLGDELSRTWVVRYATSARPGDSVSVAAVVAGGGHSTRSAVLHAAGLGHPLPTKPSLLSRGAWQSSVAALAIAAAVGALLLLAALFLGAARSGRWLHARLAPHLGPSEQRGGRRARRRRGGFRQVFASTERVFANVRHFRSLQRILTRANSPLLAAELLYICLGVGIVVGLFFAILGTPPILVMPIMGVGATLPVLFVLFKANARLKTFDNQLPDLLITIAASLKAGHSFRHAVQAVVDEGAEPAATEFRRVLTETQLGSGMDTALTDMAERVGSKQFAFVLTAVTIQRQIGGSMAGLFDMVAETVRQRQQFARKIRGLTAMGRMSAYVLAGLPFFLALAITLMNPAYMAPLWSSPTGHMLIALALGMLCVGGLLLKKIVSFKG